MPRDNHFLHGGHADQIGPKRMEGANLGGSFKAGSQHAKVNAFRNFIILVFCSSLRQHTKPLGISLGHIEEARAEALVIFTHDRIESSEVDVIGNQHKLTLLQPWTASPSSVSHEQRFHA